MAKPIPDGYSSVTPYLILKNASAAIEFYKKALGAKETYRLPAGDRIGHAEIQIGNSHVMLADENPQWNAYSPEHYKGSPVHLVIYVEDVDASATQAAGAGMKILRPVQTQFYGDRSGTFEDPFGYMWTIATHVEDVTPEQMRARMPKAENPA